MTLMECVLAVAMIALAVPAVILVLGQSHADAKKLQRLALAQRAIAAHVHDLGRNDDLAEGRLLVWAHAANGECLGRIDEAMHEDGLLRHRGELVDCLIVATPLPLEEAELLTIQVAVEYPASAPAHQRRQTHYLTQIRP